MDLWRNLTQPNGAQCSQLNVPYEQLTADGFAGYFASMNVSEQFEQVSCAAYEFDGTIFGQTVIAEFGLVCDRARMMSIVEMCFLAGAAMGSVGSGWISDQFGRRHTLMFFALIQAITGESSRFELGWGWDGQSRTPSLFKVGQIASWRTIEEEVVPRADADGILN